MKGGIAGQFAIFTSLLVLVATSTVGYMVYKGSENALKEASIDRLAHTAEIIHVRFKGIVDAIKKDVRFLAETPPVQGVVRARYGRGLDRQTYIYDDEWRDQLADIFEVFLHNRPSYYQVRFIGMAEGGRELVRVEKRDGDAYRAPWNALRTYGDQTYFQEAASIPQGSLYLSDIELSTTGSEIPGQVIPFIRAAVPVYTPQGTLFGIIMVSVDMRVVLSDMKDLVDPGKSLYIANSRGDYLLSPDSLKTFGFARGTRYLIQDDFPMVATLLSDQEYRLRLPNVALESGVSGIAYFDRIPYDRGVERQDLVLGVTAPYETFLTRVEAVRNQSAAITLLFCLGGVVMALAVSGYLTHPLRQITKAVSSFGRDGNALELPTRRQDEIGVLARTFDAMARQIQDQISELEDKERRQRITLETSAEGVIVTDAQGRIEAVNKAAERIFGYETQDLVGQNVSRLMGTEAPDEWTIAGSGREVNGLRRDGTPVPLSLAISTFELAGEAKFAGFFQDMTERKEYERALQEAKEEAEAANKAKSAFLANMSHEIRTPLTSIIGFAQVLAKQVTGNQHKFAQLIESSGRRLMETLNAVLALAKLESERIEIELHLIDVAEEVREVVQLMEPLAQHKGLALRYYLSPEASGSLARLDRGGLSSILLNLIGNAVKFTDEGEIDVHVGLKEGPRSPEPGGGEQPAPQTYVYVSVRDSGVGIDEEFLPHLFDEFRQESTGMNRSHEGSGLGLAITRRLVRLMGGDIEVESTKNVGSTFTVMFPAEARPAREDAAPPRVQRQPEIDFNGSVGARVLIVEDNPNSRFLMQTLLEEVCDVTVAANAEEALSVAQQAAYDLVLLDINLEGGGNGTDVLKALRAMPAYQDVPIVALTAYALPGDRERFLQLGFSTYLSKPFDVDDLLELTAQLLPR